MIGALQSFILRRPRKLVADRRDQEFLPAALEILETPPSPIGIALLVVICALATTTLAWAYVSRIDVIATAQGKIQPTGRVKLIQPVETGKVIGIHTANGQRVKQGEILVLLDAEEAKAEEIAFSMSFASFKAEIQRRKVALDVARGRRRSETPSIAWEADVPSAVRQRAERVLAGDLGQLAATVDSLAAQRHQKEVERDRLSSTIAAQEELLVTLKQRVDMRDTLVRKNAGSKASLIDAVESLQYQEIILMTQKGQKQESEASLEVFTREIAKSVETFIADNSQKLEEAERQADDIEQKHIKAHVKLRHMALASPIDGTVQALSVTTLGQVIASGEEIMRIVPDDSVLEIECYLQNKDIGFVKPGQDAIVKIESFPFTRFGTINAEIVRVAQDAIPEPDAQQVEGNPIKANKSTMFAGAQRTQNLVFPVTLKLARSIMEVDGAAVPLSPGMAVSVEIKTGSRRVIDYLFSPLVETASEAMHER